MKFPWVGEVRRLSCLCVVGFEGPNDDSEEMGLVVVGCLQVVGVVAFGPEMVAKMVVMVVVAVEVDDAGQVTGPVVIGDECCLDVVGVGGLGAQVVWCSRSGSCDCSVDAASSWKVLVHNMEWCGQAAQWPSAIVHKLLCPPHLESAVLSDSLSQQEPSVLPVLLRLVLNLQWSTEV